jgi:DNA repair protein RadB
MHNKKLPTNSPFDKFLNGGIEHRAVTNIYGPAGSGKTNIALLCTLSCLQQNKKVAYIDTEGSFSFERFMQIGGKEEYLKNLLLLEPPNWQEQHSKIKDLEHLVGKESVFLVIVDSLVALYRLQIDSQNFPEMNRQLATQYSLLSKTARKYDIPVLVTNQVYGKIKDGIEHLAPTSNQIAKFWSKTLIELQKLDRPNHRLAIIKKHRSMPEEKKLEFQLVQNGIKIGWL